VFLPAVVVLAISFVIQVFYVLYRTAAFYGNVFMCRIRWTSAMEFIIARTVSLITYAFNRLDEL